MPAQQHVVGERDSVADLAIVRNVRTGHQKTAVTNLSNAPIVLGAGIDGDVFANVAISTDRNLCRTATIPDRLGRSADRDKRRNARAWSNGCMAREINLSRGSSADRDIRTDDAIRTDRYVVANSGAFRRAPSRRWPSLCFASIRDHRADLSLCNELAGNLGLGPVPPDVPFPRELAHMVLKRIAGNDRTAELRLVDRHEINLLCLRSRGSKNADNTGRLGHSLDHKDAGKYRVVGKMPEKLRLVRCDVFKPNGRNRRPEYWKSGRPSEKDSGAAAP